MPPPEQVFSAAAAGGRQLSRFRFRLAAEFSLPAFSADA